MKTKGAVMELSEERIDDIMRCYKEYLSKCSYINTQELYSTIANMPSRRFWVSDKRAFVVVSLLIKGEEEILNKMRPLKREMYREIHKRVITLRNENRITSVAKLCSYVINQPAPKFYLAPGSIKMIVSKSRRRWYQKQQKQ